MADRKSRNISNLPLVIPDVPDAVTIASATDVGTSRAFNNGAATVTFTAASTGGLPSSYSITTTPTTTTTTATSSPATITGLTSATSYTATITPSNVSATGPTATSSAFTATTVPQAPTIGTVSRTNDTTVSIPFTAGATGGSSITSYTTTSSPSISLSTSGTTTPLTVTGTFAINQAYTFTIAATNANGTSIASSASNSITPFASAFESIASSVAGLGGTSSSGVTFSSIPGTYSHLQLRLFLRCSVTGGGSESLILRVNGDSGTNYSAHRLYGNGTSAFGDGYTTSTAGASTFLGDIARSGVDNSGYTIFIIDILDYANTNKYKTFRCLTGRDHNGSGRVGLYSSLWLNTSAITSISVAPETTGWQQYSHFALYGIKGA